jgi:hypothetical protein
MEYFSKGASNASSIWTTLRSFTPQDWGMMKGSLIDYIKKSKEEVEPEFEDVKKKLLDSINSEINGFCKNPKPTTDPIKDGGSVVQPRYRNCGEGPFTKGCRTAPEGPIGQVQACLKLVQDGKFWNKTQAALVSKGYPNGFTKEDIKTICGNQTEPEEVTPLPQDDEVLDVNSM